MSPPQYNPALIRTKKLQTALEPRAGYVYSLELNAWIPQLHAEEANRPITFADTFAVDAFGRLRVSNPVVLFESQLQYDLSPLIWDTITANGGTVTHLPNQSSARMRVTTAPNSSAIRQTKAYHRYRPGESQKVSTTFLIGPPVSNVTKLVGHGDAQNGHFLRQQGDGSVAIVERSFVTGAAVDAAVLQAAWNVDAFDGNGPSGLTLDLTKVQILQIDLQWLGVGRVRVGFNIGGLTYYAHEFQHANFTDTAYTTTANLPVRYEITASGAAASTADLIQICAAVVSEAGAQIERGRQFSVDTGMTARNVPATPLSPIIAVRPKATFNGIANKGQLELATYGMLPVSGNAPFRYVLLYGATVTGGAWVSAHDNSIAEFNVTATAVSGGAPIDSGHRNASVQSRSFAELAFELLKLPWCVDGAGVQIPICLAAQSTSGASTAHASMGWRELR
jgi:hypothetical protein